MNTQNLIRWAGLPAMLAGLIFVVIQPIHPPDFLPSVTTDTWVIIQSAKTLMAVFYLIGSVGIYASQAKAASWLGLAGFFLFFISWTLQLPFIFTEAFILPPIVSESPQFVEGFLSIINESASSVNLGALPILYGLAGGLYMLGGLLFGIAMFRARVLPRLATLLFAVAGPLSLILVSLLPHHLERMAALPMGLAIGWLGYALWTGRRATAIATMSVPSGAQPHRPGAS